MEKVHPRPKEKGTKKYNIFGRFSEKVNITLKTNNTLAKNIKNNKSKTLSSYFSG